MALNFWDWLLLNRHERQMMRHVDRVQREQLKAQMKMQTQMQENHIKNTPSFNSLSPEEQKQAVAFTSFFGAVASFFIALILRTIWFTASITLFIICALCVLCFIGCLVEMFKKTDKKTIQVDSRPKTQPEPSELQKFVATNFPDFEPLKEENLRVEIVYEDESKTVTRRVIEPIALAPCGENECVVAYCRIRLDYRRFRLDRIIRMKDKDGNVIEDFKTFLKSNVKTSPAAVSESSQGSE